MPIYSRDRAALAYRLASQNGGELIRFYQDPNLVKWRLPVAQNDPLFEHTVDHGTVVALVKAGRAEVIDRDLRNRPTRVKFQITGVKACKIQK